MERHKTRGIRKRRAEKRKQKIRKLFFAAVLVPFILLAVFAIIFFQKRQNEKLLRLEDAKKQETLKQEQLENGNRKWKNFINPIWQKEKRQCRRQ